MPNQPPTSHGNVPSSPLAPSESGGFAEPPAPRGRLPLLGILALLIVACNCLSLATDRWEEYVITLNTAPTRVRVSANNGLFVSCVVSNCGDISFNDFTDNKGCTIKGSDIKMRYNGVRGAILAGGALSMIFAIMSFVIRNNGNLLTVNLLFFLALAVGICQGGSMALYWHTTRLFQWCSYGSFCAAQAYVSPATTIDCVENTSYSMWCHAGAVALSVLLIMAYVAICASRRQEHGEQDDQILVQQQQRPQQQRPLPVGPPESQPQTIAPVQPLAQLNRQSSTNVPYGSSTPATTKGGASPQSPRAASVTKAPMPARQSSPTNEGDVELPADGNYRWDEETGMYWSDDHQLFLNIDWYHYYDPAQRMWYDPDKDEWYADDSNHFEPPPPMH